MNVPVTKNTALPVATGQRYVTVRAQGQRFAMSMRVVRDVMRYQPLTPVPLAPKSIAGLLILRGQMVAALDLRGCFSMRVANDITQSLMVIVEHRNEWHALVVDTIGDAISLSPEQIDTDTSLLDSSWRHAATGSLRYEGELLVILDIGQLIEPMTREEHAA